MAHAMVTLIGASTLGVSRYPLLSSVVAVLATFLFVAAVVSLSVLALNWYSRRQSRQGGAGRHDRSVD